MHLCQCQTGKLTETMWPLSDSNEKAWTNGDTTGSVPQATRPGTLPVPGTSTDAEKVGLHGTQGEAGPQ